MKFPVKKQWFKGAALASLLALANVTAFAADEAQPSELKNSLAIVLLVVIAGLLLAIGLLAHVVIGAGELYVARLKEKQKSTVATVVKAVILITFCLATTTSFAADAPADDATKEAVVTTIGGLSKSSFYSYRYLSSTLNLIGLYFRYYI